MKMLNGVWMTLYSLDVSPAFLFISLPEESSHRPSRDKCTNFVESLGLRRICHILCVRSWARRLSSVNFSLLSEVWTFSSVQFSRSVVSDSLRPHELQHARPPCPSPTLGVYSNSCPLSRWCHPAISSSVVPFSSCPQSLPASGSFPMSQLFAWGGQLLSYIL